VQIKVVVVVVGVRGVERTRRAKMDHSDGIWGNG